MIFICYSLILLLCAYSDYGYVYVMSLTVAISTSLKRKSLYYRYLVHSSAIPNTDELIYVENPNENHCYRIFDVSWSQGMYNTSILWYIFCHFSIMRAQTYL